MESYYCNDSLRERILSNLNEFKVVTHGTDGLRHAAVALTVVDCQADPSVYDIRFEMGWETHAALVLTRRAAKMRRHAGQWALPGGRLDEGEIPEDAALRELSEEVGLTLGSERVLGRLDDFTTRSGFVMTPIVLWGGSDVALVANPDEVAAIHRIPIAEFMRSDAPILEESTTSEHPVLLMPVGNSWIAAPTAAIIYQFRQVAILGKHERVAHYEQPSFAWR